MTGPIVIDETAIVKEVAGRFKGPNNKREYMDRARQILEKVGIEELIVEGIIAVINREKDEKGG